MNKIRKSYIKNCISNNGIENIENLTDIQNKNSGLTAAVSLIVSVKSVNRIILPPMEKGLHMPW